MSTSNSNNEKENEIFSAFYDTLKSGKKFTRSQVSSKAENNKDNSNKQDISLTGTFAGNLLENDSRSLTKLKNTSKKRKILKKKSQNKKKKSTKSENIKNEKKKIKSYIPHINDLNSISNQNKNNNMNSSINQNHSNSSFNFPFNGPNNKFLINPISNISNSNFNAFSSSYNNTKSDKKKLDINIKNIRESAKYEVYKKDTNFNNVNKVPNKSFGFNEAGQSVNINTILNKNPNANDISIDHDSNILANKEDISNLYNSKMEKGKIGNLILKKNNQLENSLMSTDKIEIHPYYLSSYIPGDNLQFKLEEKMLYNNVISLEKYLGRYIIFKKNSQPILAKIINILYEENEKLYKISDNFSVERKNYVLNKLKAFEILVLNKENNFLILNSLNIFQKNSLQLNLESFMYFFEKSKNNFSSESLTIELYGINEFTLSNIYVIEQVFLEKNHYNIQINETFDNFFAVVSKIFETNISDKNFDQEKIEIDLDGVEENDVNNFCYRGFYVKNFFSNKDNQEVSNYNFNNYDYADYSIESVLQLVSEKDLEIISIQRLSNLFGNFLKNFNYCVKPLKLFSCGTKIFQDLLSISGIIVANNINIKEKNIMNNILLIILINMEYLIFLKRIEFYDKEILSNIFFIENGESKNILNKNINDTQENDNMIVRFNSIELTIYPQYLKNTEFFDNPEIFIFHEALIKTKASENICLILAYNSQSNSIYVRYYKSGLTKWLYFQNGKKEKIKLGSDRENINKLNNGNLNCIITNSNQRKETDLLIKSQYWSLDDDEIVEEIYINKLKGGSDKNVYFREILKNFINSPNIKTISDKNNQQDNLNIGLLNLASYSNDKPYKDINFLYYTRLKFFVNFFIEEKSRKDFYNSKYLIIKKWSENSNINPLYHLECKTCTYPIKDFEFRYCRFCRKIYHIECVDLNQRNLESEYDIFGKIINFWSCKDCKICKICYTNCQFFQNSPKNSMTSMLSSKLEDNSLGNSHLNQTAPFINSINTVSSSINKKSISQKIICKICFLAFHYNCLPNNLRNIYPNFSNSSQDIETYKNFKCENCIKCISCNKTNADLAENMTWSADFNFCSECKRRYEKKEFCPLCKKLWSPNETKMVECKCKFWVHMDCDRILTDETFKKLGDKKTSTYHCPFCRIKKKLTVIENVIEECVKQDKNAFFVNPVDLNKVKQYTKVIKVPMSFFQMKIKMRQGIYLENPDELENDLKLIFNNAKNYNFPNNKIYKEAEILSDICLKIIEKSQSNLYQNSLEYYLFDRNIPIEYDKNETNIGYQINLEDASNLNNFFSNVFNLLNTEQLNNGTATNNIFGRDINNLFENRLFFNLIMPNIGKNSHNLQNYVFYFNNQEVYLKYNEKSIKEIFNEKYQLIKANQILSKINEYKIKWGYLIELHENLLNINCNQSETESKTSGKINNLPLNLNRQHSELSIEILNNFPSHEKILNYENCGNLKYDMEDLQNINNNILINNENLNANYGNKKTDEQPNNSFNKNNLNLKIIENTQMKDKDEELKLNNLENEVVNLDNENKEMKDNQSDESYKKLVISKKANIDNSNNSSNESFSENIEENNKLDEKEIQKKIYSLKRKKIRNFENETNILDLDENIELIDVVKDNNGDENKKDENLVEFDADKMDDIGNEIENEENPNIQKISMKKTLRNCTKNKLLLKNNDLQHELDVYNSNFEVINKKNQKLSKLSNKIEFVENLEDFEKNISLELDQQEERLMNLFNYQKDLDSKISYLYINKAKKIIKDKDSYLEYLDFVDYIVYCKDENKRKKINQTFSNLGTDKREINKSARKPSFSPQSISSESEEIDKSDRRKIGKTKKGRPKLNKNNLNFIQPKVNLNNPNENEIDLKINMEFKNQKLLGNKKRRYSDNKNQINLVSTTANKNATKSSGIHIKNSLNGLKNHNNTLNHSNTEYSVSNFSNNLGNCNITDKKNNFNSENKCVNESTYYDELYSTKNYVNNFCLPNLICINNFQLIFEPSCYTCGSFDDMKLMITCSSCKENFHSYCISNSENITNNIDLIKIYNWKCSKCKICEKCQINNNEISLLYCDSCDRAYHICCLDVPLSVVPESGWKCLNCFKCQNCEIHIYYNKLIPIKDKDYSIFTRNFNYCFECGMTLFYQSLCAKCEKSHFKLLSKNLIFLENKSGYENKKSQINENSSIMLKCKNCESWFHSKCLGFDEVNINYYFESYEKFCCLDCHLTEKYKERYLEVTFVKYLEVLKMSYIVMCFSKLIMIILRSISKDSNIKLHSKLLKAYLKENYHILLKEKNICMLLELIKLDIFILKDKEANIKKRNLESVVNNSINHNQNNFDNANMDQINKDNINEAQLNLINEKNLKINESNENEIKNTTAIKLGNSFKLGNKSTNQEEREKDIQNESNQEKIGKANSNLNTKEKLMNEIPNCYYKYEKPEIISLENFLNVNELTNSIEENKYLEKIKNIHVDNETIISTIKKMERERNSKIFIKLKRKNLFIFDMKNSKNNFKNNKFISNALRGSEDILYTIKDELNIDKGLGLNENNIGVNDINKQTHENIIRLNENKFQKQTELQEIFEESKEKSRDYLNHNLNPNFPRKYRIKLKAEKNLNNEIKEFFENTTEISSNNSLNFENLMSFYKFDLDKYYGLDNSFEKNLFPSEISMKSHIQIFEDINSNISKEMLENLDKSRAEINIKSQTNQSNSTTNSPEHDNLILEVLEKIRSYMKLQNCSKKLRKFILNLILNSIIILKTSLLKWLVNQILNNNENNSIYIQKNNLLFDWVNLNDKYINEHHIINSENTQDLSDDEIAKFLDYIDPLEKSVTSEILSCEFCSRAGPRRISGRLIHIKNGVWAHVNCTIFSKGVFETAEGNLLNVLQILNKIKSFKCILCRKLGATITCEFKKCGKNYHFACALAKQSIFTKNKKFYCHKCSNSKDEILANFDTKRRFVIIKNTDFINDSRLNYLIDNNFNNFSPKYLVGSIVKFGNTSILKFFNLNKKDLSVENYDINIIKLVENFNKIDEFKEEKRDEENSNLNQSEAVNEKAKIDDFDISEQVYIRKLKESNSGNTITLKKDSINENIDDFEGIKINMDLKYENNEDVKLDDNYQMKESRVDYIKKTTKDNKTTNDMKIENYETDDILQMNIENKIKDEEYIQKINISNKKFLLLQINENGLCLTEIDKFSIKDVEKVFQKYKILNNFDKSDFLKNENLNFSDNKLEEIKDNPLNLINQSIKIPTEKIISLNPTKDNFEILMKNSMNKFNDKLEDYIIKRILSKYEYSMALKINRSLNWMGYFNLQEPFNLLLKNFSQYSKIKLDFSEGLSSQLLSNECIEMKMIRKDNKSKLENFMNLIRSKNVNDNECFRQVDYINNHREMKLLKRNIVGLDDLAFGSTDKRTNKFNKQSYKNLERTMSTNINETDLPLAMKFRNYKIKIPKVTIGPSTIHRNGLFALQAFQPGEIVIEYVGELITNKIADYREIEYNFKGFGDCYMFRLDKNQIIDATKYGNLARFINHCCDPNCSAQVNSILDKKHILLYAKRTINQMEEITYDYNFECEEEKIQCRCGAKNCQGRLN